MDGSLAGLDEDSVGRRQAGKTTKVAQAEMTIEQARQVLPIGTVPRMVRAMSGTDPAASRHPGNRTHEIPRRFDNPSALPQACAGHGVLLLKGRGFHARLPGLPGRAGSRGPSGRTPAADR